ncbi:cysteine synthase family protein [Oceanobacillus piezotolerans]|uniref:Cysteine synthase family protein n=1 Tax=Oceanobacillus piezotolerans TaxID=2448030 RepID=A0A498D806_9BACI|nr:cysteine synthase family protein [Oceanobacillus piezotolerans]RLL44977.1 cysteine synthase family protein [Oceanobacillus piezotolerans]
MTIYHSIQEIIGHTPLLEITQFDIPKEVHLYAKLEYLNPGGSIKDRLGVALVEEAMKKGLLKAGGTIIEPTAGNTGIGLALAAKHKNVSVVFCVPNQFSKEKQDLMKALGAIIVPTPEEEGMRGAIAKAKELLNEIPNSYSPQQFINPTNPKTYYDTLGPEIWDDLKPGVDVFIAGAGSGGTFTGTAKYLKEKNKNIKTIIVEPQGSILGGGKAGPHRTEGIGMEFIPEFMNPPLHDEVYTVSDENAFSMVQLLAEKEGLLIGSSSGAVMYAALEEAKHAKQGTNIVTVFPDGSDRYLSKNIYG